MAKSKKEDNIGMPSLVDRISEAAVSRFIVVTEGQEIELLKKLAPAKLTNIEVVRLQRIAMGTPGWRTLIVATIGSSTEIDLAIEWSAFCKEELLDPESSDLYLIVAVKNLDLSLEECVSIEASEKFCRKFILRPNETVDQLLSRTFLLEIAGDSSSEGIIDPLTIALSETAKEAAWFTEDQRDLWRQLLLSSKSGHELVERLFTFPVK